MSGFTLDAGALIAADQSDRRMILLLDRAATEGYAITVPATALAQVIRNPSRQARVMRLVRQITTDLRPLDGPDAAATGMLLGSSHTSDIADAHVVVCARRAQQAVITSDASDLRRIDPQLALIEI